MNTIQQLCPVMIMKKYMINRGFSYHNWPYYMHHANTHLLSLSSTLLTFVSVYFLLPSSVGNTIMYEYKFKGVALYILPFTLR